jgi:hypothetical protein
LSGPKLIGSFNVGQGPSWSTNPPVYSCIQACNLIFGSSPYTACSTVSTSINHEAYLSGWGDGTYCTTPASDTFSKGTNYNCNAPDCAFSAYVGDWCSDSINYCWHTTGGACPTPSATPAAA